MLEEVEHHGCGAMVEGGEGVKIPAPGGAQQPTDLVQRNPASTHEQPAPYRRRHYTGVLGVELSL
jgi:hypothetical protein